MQVVLDHIVTDDGLLQVGVELHHEKQSAGVETVFEGHSPQTETLLDNGQQVVVRGQPLDVVGPLMPAEIHEGGQRAGVLEQDVAEMSEAQVAGLAAGQGGEGHGGAEQLGAVVHVHQVTVDPQPRALADPPPRLLRQLGEVKLPHPHHVDDIQGTEGSVGQVLQPGEAQVMRQDRQLLQADQVHERGQVVAAETVDHAQRAETAGVRQPYREGQVGLGPWQLHVLQVDLHSTHTGRKELMQHVAVLEPGGAVRL